MHVDERLPGETGKAYALRVLKQNIVNLELIPGAMVSANELAIEMGLSKTPVREALIELSRIGIVEIFPQSGSRITLVDRNMVEESRFMRLSLECSVVRQLCEHTKMQVILRLQDNIKLQQFYLENHMHEELQNMDDEFHRALFRSANKMHVYEIMRNFSIHFDRIRRLRLVTEKDVNVVNDHCRIYEAISDGNADEAVAQMQIHLTRYQMDENQLKKEYAPYFK